MAEKGEKIMKLESTISMEDLNGTAVQEMKPSVAHSPKSKHHVPPHVRKKMIQIEFDEEDKAIFFDVAQDEDEARGWMKTIQNAPPEIKIIVNQIIKMIKEVA